MKATKTTSQGATIHRMPRRTSVPTTEPRYDDERGGRLDNPAPMQGSLALDLAPSSAPTVDRADTGKPHLRLVESPKREEKEDKFFARQRTPRTALPDPKSWSGRYVQSLVEVLAGDRPAAQLVRWTQEAVYADVIRRVGLLGRTTTAGVRGLHGRALVKSVHVCEPSDGIVEASVHVRHGSQSRAIALRLEGLDGRWRCTALQLG